MKAWAQMLALANSRRNTQAHRVAGGTKRAAQLRSQHSARKSGARPPRTPQHEEGGE